MVIGSDILIIENVIVTSKAFASIFSETVTFNTLILGSKLVKH